MVKGVYFTIFHTCCMEPGGLQSVGSFRVGHNWATEYACRHTYCILCWKTARMWEFKVGAFREKSIAEIFPLAYEERKVNTTGVSGHWPPPGRDTHCQRAPHSTATKALGSARPSCRAQRGGHVTVPDDGDRRGLILIASVL